MSFDSKDDLKPSKLKRRAKAESTTNRIAEVTTSDKLAKVSKGVTPTNTQKNDEWALSTFQVWIKERNRHVSSQEDHCPA